MGGGSGCRGCWKDAGSDAGGSLGKGNAADLTTKLMEDVPSMVDTRLSSNSGDVIWNRQKLVAFDDMEKECWASEEVGPVVPDVMATNANREKLEKALVGKLSGRRVPFSYLNTELHRRWDHFGQFRLITVPSDCFMCLFDDQEACKAVLLGGPWIVDGQIIGIEQWNADFSPDSLNGLTSPVWIRFPQLSMLYWDRKNIGLFASRIGQPIGIDLETNTWGWCSYARVCVRIDLSKQLPKGVWIRDAKGDYFQHVEYEGISMLCFGCGRIGHKVEVCPHLARFPQVDTNCETADTPAEGNAVSVNAKRDNDCLDHEPIGRKVQKSEESKHGRVQADAADEGHSGEREYGQLMLVEPCKHPTKVKGKMDKGKGGFSTAQHGNIFGWNSGKSESTALGKSKVQDEKKPDQGGAHINPKVRDQDGKKPDLGGANINLKVKDQDEKKPDQGGVRINLKVKVQDEKKPDQGDAHINLKVKDQDEKKPDQDDANITLKVKDQDGTVVFFRIKRSIQLKKLMNAYCDRLSVDLNKYRFIFDCRQLDGEQTPDELGLKDGDEIVALRCMCGC